MYDLIKSNVLSEFRFFEEVVGEPAIYILTLDVDETCVKDPPLVDESIEGLSGKLQYASIPREDIDERIGLEEFNASPGIILPDGT